MDINEHSEGPGKHIARIPEIRQESGISATDWHEVEPDVRVSGIGELFRKMDPINAANLIYKSFAGPLVVISERCKQNIYAHTLSSRKEMGGLLIGNTYSLPYDTRSGYNFATFISDSVPSMKPRNSPVSLRMDIDIWTRIKNHIANGKIVVGWYHSHPEIGAFFSGTDRVTQRGFFSNPYSLGVVMDPYKDELRCYFGADSKEMDCHLEVIADETALSYLAAADETNLLHK